jgi:hypothetical protein
MLIKAGCDSRLLFGQRDLILIRVTELRNLSIPVNRSRQLVLTGYRYRPDGEVHQSELFQIW